MSLISDPLETKLQEVSEAVSENEIKRIVMSFQRPLLLLHKKNGVNISPTYDNDLKCAEFISSICDSMKSDLGDLMKSAKYASLIIDGRNMKMERQRWPETSFIMGRSGTQYVAMVTELFKYKL